MQHLIKSHSTNMCVPSSFTSWFTIPSREFPGDKLETGFVFETGWRRLSVCKSAYK